VLGIVLPTVLVFIYLACFASSQWTAEAQVSLKSALGSDASPSLSFGRSGLSFGSSTDDALVAAYFHSNDLAQAMDEQLHLRQHWQDHAHDFVFRLASDATIEDYDDFFKSRTRASIDTASGVITVRAQAYDRAYAKRLIEAMIARAETAVNGFGQEIVRKRLAIFEDEVARTERELKAATQAMLTFQAEHHLLDAKGQAAAGAGVIAELDAKIVAEQATLSEMLAVQGESSDAVLRQRARIKAVQDQRAIEISRLVGDQNGGDAVNQLVAKQAELDFTLQRSVEAHGLAQKALEEARVEAAHQLKHLVVIDPPSLPERPTQPLILYWTVTVFLALLLIYAIGSMVLATIREHRD
jgi:capsular polysaccharide transport system permease protein